MRRSRARGVLIAAVTLALVALGFLLGRTMVDRRASALPDGPHLRPEVSQRIGDFRRVKVKDGRKVWELTAREAEYLEEEAHVRVTEPQVAFFSDAGESVEIKSREGRVYVSGNNVERIELGGGVEVKVGDYVLRAGQAMYFQAQDIIVAPGPVSISGSAFELDGRGGMIFELGRRRAQFAHGVKTTLRGRASGEADAKDAGPEPAAAIAPPPVQVASPAGVGGGAVR